MRSRSTRAARLFIGDRQNSRIQIYDQEATFIAEWKQFGRPSGNLHRQGRGTIYVADSESASSSPAPMGRIGVSARIRIVGQRATARSDTSSPMRRHSRQPAVRARPKRVTVDASGSVYGAEFTQDVKKAMGSAACSLACTPRRRKTDNRK